MNEDVYTFCGDVLKWQIRRKSMTHEAVAKAVGINKNTLNKATNSGLVTVESLLKICNYLHVSPGKLFVSEPYSETIEEQHVQSQYRINRLSSSGAAEDEILYNTNDKTTEIQSVQVCYEMTKDEEIQMLRRLNANYLRQIKQLEAIIRESDISLK